MHNRKEEDGSWSNGAVTSLSSSSSASAVNGKVIHAATATATCNRAAVLLGPKQLEIQDWPLPENPGDEEVTVNVITSGICGSDLHRYEMGNLAFESQPPGEQDKPLVLGHESAGIVTKVGLRVKHVQVGDNVLLEPSNPCFKCADCLSSGHQRCKAGSNCSMLSDRPGYLLQHITLPARCAIPFGDALSWEEAACMQPLAVAVHGARRAGIKPHQNVMVLGAGPVGLFVMAVAKAYGAKTIMATDVSELRLKTAKDTVATHCVLRKLRAEDSLACLSQEAAGIIKDSGIARDGPNGFDVVVEATGAPPCVKLAVLLARPGGTVLQVGLGPREVALPIRLITAKEIEFKGAIRYSVGSFEDALDLVKRKLVDLKPFINKRMPLTKTKEAIEELKNAQIVKLVIYNNAVDQVD